MDLGCGCGYLLQVLEKNGYKNLFGVEIDKKQMENAKKNLKFTKLYKIEITKFLKKVKDKFDIIILYDVIEHIPKNNIINLLNLIYKRLNNNGILIIKTPNADLPLTAGKMRYIDFGHEIIFNKDSIETVLRIAKFKSFIFKPASSISVLKTILKNFFDLFLRFFLCFYLSPREAFSMILTPNFITIAKK